MNQAYLDISALSFRYRKFMSAREHTLNHISLQINKGDVLGLIGSNGAGKTTLVSLIMGLLKPVSGKITLGGKPIHLGLKDITLVPQEYAFYERLNAIENLQYFASVCRIPKHQQAQRIHEVIEKCHLEALANRRSSQYSGGEKRRLNFAIGLLSPGKVFILDEPTANVDPHSRALILDLIRELNREGTTLIYTSHLLDEVQSLCNSIALIHDGSLKVSGPTDTILKKYDIANTQRNAVESLFMQLTGNSQ